MYFLIYTSCYKTCTSSSYLLFVELDFSDRKFYFYLSQIINVIMVDIIVEYNIFGGLSNSDCGLLSAINLNQQFNIYIAYSDETFTATNALWSSKAATIFRWLKSLLALHNLVNLSRRLPESHSVCKEADEPKTRYSQNGRIFA